MSQVDFDNKTKILHLVLNRQIGKVLEYFKGVESFYTGKTFINKKNNPIESNKITYDIDLSSFDDDLIMATIIYFKVLSIAFPLTNNGSYNVQIFDYLNYLNDNEREWLTNDTYIIYINFEQVNNYFNSSESVKFPNVIFKFLILNNCEKYFLYDYYFIDFLSFYPELYDNVRQDYEHINNGTYPGLISLSAFSLKSTGIMQYKEEKLENKSMNYYNHNINETMISVTTGDKRNIYIKDPSYARFLNQIHPIIKKLVSIQGIVLWGGAVDFMLRRGETMKEKIQDYDFTVYGKVDHMEIINNFTNILVTYAKEILKELFIFKNDKVITFQINELKIQLIKRNYVNIEDLLLSIDLDSTAVAYFNKNGKDEIVCLKRYQLAVKYGINIVDPIRNSKLFNDRLVKYTSRGYLPFIPYALHKVGNYIYEIYNPSIKVAHISELIASMLNIKFKKVSNDKGTEPLYDIYNNNRLLYIGTEQAGNGLFDSILAQANPRYRFQGEPIYLDFNFIKNLYTLTGIYTNWISDPESKNIYNYYGEKESIIKLDLISQELPIDITRNKIINIPTLDGSFYRVDENLIRELATFRLKAPFDLDNEWILENKNLFTEDELKILLDLAIKFTVATTILNNEDTDIVVSNLDIDEWYNDINTVPEGIDIDRIINMLKGFDYDEYLTKLESIKADIS